MKTRHQVETELILDFLADCRRKDTSGQYHAMLERAAEMAQRTGFECKIEGTYVYVPSGTHQGVRYEVNGFCHCPAATHDPKHLCKHYALAKAYRHAVQRLEDIEIAGAIHTHRMLCGHASGHVVCYDAACPDPPEVVCPVCAAGECETPAEAPTGAVDVTTHGEFDTWVSYPVTLDATPRGQHAPEVVQGQGGDSLHARMEHSRLTAGDIPVPAFQTTTDYEPNPSHQHVCTWCGRPYACWLDAPPHAAPWQARCSTCVQLPVSAAPLPEAPASLNLKVKRGCVEVMYTMRGQTDAAVLARLPAALAGLETALGVRFTQEAQ